MNYSPVSQVTISLDFGWDPIRVGTLARSAEGRNLFRIRSDSPPQPQDFTAPSSAETWTYYV